MKTANNQAATSNNPVRIARTFAACLVVAVMLRPDLAVSQEAAPRDSADNTGEDFFRPPANLFQPSIQYRTAPASGSNGAISNVTTETLNLRYEHSMDLAPTWILALRTDLPTRAKNPVSSTNPDGDFLYGVGDVDFQAALIRNLTPRLAAGFGVRLIAPTGGDIFGSGKWQAMPVVGARYALWEISASSYFEPLVRYDISFAGDPTRKNISNLQFAPTLHIGLPEHWFITFYPSTDIRVNFGDPVTGQTGRLFLPFDFRFGRQLDENTAISLEIGVPIIKDYPVYNVKTQLRYNLTF